MNDVDVIVLTETDCRRWIRDALNNLGCSFDQLAGMHRTGDYDTIRHRIAWVQIGQWYGVQEPAGDDE